MKYLKFSYLVIAFAIVASCSNQSTNFDVFGFTLGENLPDSVVIVYEDSIANEISVKIKLNERLLFVLNEDRVIKSISFLNLSEIEFTHYENKLRNIALDSYFYEGKNFQKEDCNFTSWELSSSLVTTFECKRMDSGIMTNYRTLVFSLTPEKSNAPE